MADFHDRPQALTREEYLEMEQAGLITRPLTWGPAAPAQPRGDDRTIGYHAERVVDGRADAGGSAVMNRHVTPRVAWERQCAGKIRHATRAEARVHRKRIPPARVGHLTVYRCPWCDGFHVGHAWRDEAMQEMAARHATTLGRDVTGAVAAVFHCSDADAAAILDDDPTSGGAR